MNKVEIENKTYVDINGKTFKLLRCFEGEGYPFDPRLLQVTGKFNLMREDLPNKDWRMIKSNADEVTVYTLFDKKYAMFESSAENRKIIFFAASYEGAMILAFTFLNHHYSLDYEPEKIEETVFSYIEKDKRRLRGISKLTDKGNSKVDAVMVRFAPDGWNGFNDEPDDLIECFENE